jgi:Domain of unknown function (DUF4351)
MLSREEIERMFSLSELKQNVFSLAGLEALGKALLDFNDASDLQNWLRSHG